LDISKIQLTQPSLVELGLRLSLAKILLCEKQEEIKEGNLV
jgi:hypothetical protein